jgi:mRNA interferase HigB
MGNYGGLGASPTMMDVRFIPQPIRAHARRSLDNALSFREYVERVISRKALREFADAHQDAETPLDDWYRTAKRLWWASLVDVRKTYPHADAVGEFTVFNIGGNKYRLAAYINYRTGKVYVRHVMTHEEYSRED